MPLALHSLWPIHKRIIKKIPFYATNVIACLHKIHDAYILCPEFQMATHISFLSQLSRLGSQFFKSKISSMPLFHEGRDCIYLIHCSTPQPRWVLAHSRIEIHVWKYSFSSIIYHQPIYWTGTLIAQDSEKYLQCHILIV